MDCQRFTRLTNAFSKKLENHTMAISIYFMFYNFVRPHQTLTKESGDAGKRSPTTPAMKAGLTDHIWSLEELCALLPTKKPNARADKELVLKALNNMN